MTSLANLPPPVGGSTNKGNLAVQSFDNDAWGDADWNFDDFDIENDTNKVNESANK